MKTKTVKGDRRQNPVYVAMTKRHASTTTTMKHKTAPRGGNRNKQNDYKSENY